MLELNIEKNSGQGWPMKAASGKIAFVFGGNLEADRVSKERLKVFLENTLLAVLWSLLVLGILSLAAAAYLGFNAWGMAYVTEGKFLFESSSYAFVFWISMLTNLYLWAKYMEKNADGRDADLASLEERSWQQVKEETVDVYELFDKPAKKAWNNSLKFAQKRQRDLEKLFNEKSNEAPQILATDLLLSLLENTSVASLFYRIGVSVKDVAEVVKNYSLLAGKHRGLMENFAQIPFSALQEASKLHNKAIDPLMLLCALPSCIDDEHIIQAVFLNINLSQEKLENIASWLFHLKLLGEDLRLFSRLSKFKPDSDINTGLTSVPTVFLDRYGQDLTRLAKYARLPVALGRAHDLKEMFKIATAGSGNIVVKGDVGSGRTTLINELAYKMASEQVPSIYQDKRLVKLEISGILGSGQKTESLLVQTLKEAVFSGNIILVIEDIHELAKAVTASGLSLLDILINFLQSHQLTVIATTSVEDYTEHLRDAPNFEQVFNPYELRHLSRNEILLACCIRCSLLEAHNDCLFKYQAIEQAVDLSDIYIRGQNQPQKAIAVLVEAAARAKQAPHKIVTETLIQEIISEKTHIPAQTLKEDETEKLLHLEELMGRRVIGQRAAVTAVAEGLRRARSGLASGARPLASFLFLGPTGVGKTEIARTLADIYFGEDRFLLRLDMSEYHGPDGITKLLGRSDMDNDTPIVRHIKNYPFCLLLLDEFEKASPEITNLFLQILEDGRLTSGKGEVLDLTHTLIIATSNAGSTDIQDGIRQGLSIDRIKTRLFNQTLNKFFPPELLNRFDAVVVFSPLTQDEIEQVSLLQLQALQKELLQKGVKANFTINVARDVAQNAYDPALGARPIRRYIQDHLEAFVAKLLLQKKLKRGSIVTIDLVDGEYRLG
ncbi:MAG: AAA family ATPase [Patescibacteria group bacterium]|nr:AAA family ATPase [Patescibacteria group bacterium]